MYRTGTSYRVFSESDTCLVPTGFNHEDPDLWPAVTEAVDIPQNLLDPIEAPTDITHDQPLPEAHRAPVYLALHR
jgi:hypothetical protein